jgi:hypothetical protein
MKPSDKEMARILEEKGYGIIPPSQFRIDMEDSFRQIWAQVKDFTMTSVERGYALYKAVMYIIESGINGDFVECGVWKGGSCMLIARTLLEAGVSDRLIYLYDTFEGMPEPGDKDQIAWNGKSVHEKWDSDKAGLTNNFTDWAVGLEAVKETILKTGYPDDNIRYVEGMVEESLKTERPEQICLLRLDTDWYDSTRAELDYLYPLLNRGAVLIIDDYGHFTGAKLAVDEYFNKEAAPILLNRIDYTGRIGIKL